MGKKMARLMLERKGKIILWDIYQLKLDDTVSELKIYAAFFRYTMDISNPDPYCKRLLFLNT